MLITEQQSGLIMCGWLKPLLGLALCLAISACSSSDSAEEVPSLTGFWVGSTVENVGIVQSTVVSYVLFHEDTAYILREDESQLGGVAATGETGRSDLLMDIYPYASPDDINFFYVGTYNNIKMPLDALQNSELELVINYHDNIRSGHMDLALDVDQQLEVTLERAAGKWNTTDAELVISSDGGFSGWNSQTSCQWEGDLSLLTTNLYSINIGRSNCSEFNITLDEASVEVPEVTADGFALIDGDGVLHFIVTEFPNILWMRFDPVAATVVTETETETTTE